MRSILILSVMALSACDMSSMDGFGSSETSAPEPPVVEETAPADNFSADVRVIPTAEIVGQMVSPPAITVTPNEDSTVTISGGNQDGPSAGTTAGAAFVFGPDLEQQIAGHSVRIKLLAKSDVEGANMIAAYSTNEVGNSGWQEFALTDTFEEYSFPMKIPPVKNGRDDYLGLLAPSGDVTIAAVGVDIGEPFAPAPAVEEEFAPE